MEKDPKIFLKHILESIHWIEVETANLSEKDFLKNVPKQDMVIRRLEIIGEAARNLPKELLKKNPEVPWQDIMDMRNKLIHGYFGIDLELVWRVVQDDIPVLKEQVHKMLKLKK